MKLLYCSGPAFFSFVSCFFIFSFFHFLSPSFHFPFNFLSSTSFHFLSFPFHLPFIFLSISFHLLLFISFRFPFISFHSPFISFQCELDETDERAERMCIGGNRRAKSMIDTFNKRQTHSTSNRSSPHAISTFDKQ